MSVFCFLFGSSLKDQLSTAKKELSSVESELKRLEQHFNIYSKNGESAQQVANFKYVIKMQEPKLPKPIGGYYHVSLET